MTEQQLQTLCREWQGILRLQDWDITVRVKRAYDMPSRVAGTCNSTTKLKEAVIVILDAQDEEPDLIHAIDYEKALVHELLHVHFAQLHDEYDSPVHFEQAVEMIACALIRLKRQATS